MIPHPKKQIKKCQVDGCFNDVPDNGRLCPNCLFQQAFNKKTIKIRQGYREKIIKPKIGTANKTKSVQVQKTEELRKVIDKCHNVWARYIKGEDLFLNCSTCNRVAKSELMGIHAGHLYEKAEYWPLAYLYENGGEQCYNCNVNKGGKQLELRKALIEKRGRDAILKLDEFATEIKSLINSGLINKRPNWSNKGFFDAYLARLKDGSNFNFNDIIRLVTNRYG